MPLFESQTPEVIRERILTRMETTLQTREGSFAYDQASPVSFELWRCYLSMDELVDAFYVTEESGPWLDVHAALLGLGERRAGTRAMAEVRFTGRDGVTVPAGTQFFSPAGLSYELAADVVLKDGGGEGLLIAGAVGDISNVGSGEISQIMRNIPGLSGWTAEAAEGGTDPESDGSLFERIDFRRKHPATSGNENHYIQWALECDGVGAAKVERLWDGPGTVRVILVGYDRRPVDGAVVSACAAYIETQRPVGAEVTVISAAGTPIHVTAAVLIDGGTTLAAVRADFAAKLDAYLRALAFEQYTVYINRVGALLSSVEGVVDYTNLTVNGGTENVAIDPAAVPIPGEVVLS